MPLNNFSVTHFQRGRFNLINLISCSQEGILMDKNTLKEERIPTALTIAGSDSGGGAGIQADLKSFAAVKVHGTSAITAITAQNTKEVRKTQDVNPEIIKSQVRAVVEDIGVDAAKTGMLHTSKIIKTVSSLIEEYKFPVVTDPVMIAKSGATLLKKEAIGELKRLIPKTTIITPNRYEAEKLTGMSIQTLQDAKNAAKKLVDRGCRGVIIKGGHLQTKIKSIDILYTKENGFNIFEKPRLETTTDHGTGCSFSASIAGYLAKGYSLPKAVRNAKNLVWHAIKYGFSLGEGHGPVNPLALLYNKAENDDNE